MTNLITQLPFDMQKSWVMEATMFQNQNKQIVDFTHLYNL